MLNPHLHSLRLVKTELTLVVSQRHFTTDVLIFSSHLFSHAVDLGAIEVNFRELGPTRNLLVNPEHPLSIFIGLNNNNNDDDDDDDNKKNNRKFKAYRLR